MSATTLKALSLYRNIMRLHAQVLPTQCKDLGDVYVRKEFKKHMYGGICSLVQFDKFLSSWTEYLVSLQGGYSSGQDISNEKLILFNKEQKMKLIDLKREISG